MTHDQIAHGIAVLGLKDRIIDAAERSMFDLDYSGFCVNCGTEYHDIEPDARDRYCDDCGRDTVLGAEELMFYCVA